MTQAQWLYDFAAELASAVPLMAFARASPLNQKNWWRLR
jgi:hypothetical protein